MKAVLSVCIIALAVASRLEVTSTSGYSFEQYKVEFKKAYTNAADEASHRAIFERNLQTIVAHNNDLSQSWKMGVNQFTDLSKAEMSSWFGFNYKQANSRRASSPYADLPNIPVSQLPDSVDWRTANPPIVSPVKNQGACGSCWAFAAVEGIESAVAQATGKLLSLSAQQIVSCTPNPDHCGGTGGCEGATAELAFDYVAKNGGISNDQNYPYTARTGTCKAGVPKAASIKGFVKLPENNYTALLTAVATVGPIAISADATSWSFYSSGVFTGCPGQGKDVIVNHAIQLVGYGETNGSPYWLVRNSWGAGWGEKGYIRIFRRADGDMSKWCHRDPRPQDGSGCQGGPSPITVCGSCGIWYDNCYATGGSLE